MSGLLANLMGAATAALNLRSQDAPARAPRVDPNDGAFASALSAALTPRQRAEERAPARESDAKRAMDEAEREREADSARASGRAAASGAVAPNAGAATAAANEAAAGAAGAAGASAPAAAAEAAGDAEVAAADAAAVAGPGPARRNPTVVRSSLEGLDPEFRARLERVIARMEKEHGHDVRIVETMRDQARQEYLFAQGRTRPGPVVTWTRSSNHTQGRAADLIVDGTYDNPIAMVRLARIAREEGLRTLGSRDPGHVELPAGVRVERLAVGAGASSLLDGGVARGAEAARAATAALAAAPVAEAAPRPANGGIAQVARVAEVAQVAQVAQVARVATVATPGSIGARGIEAPSAPAIAMDQAPAAMAGQLAGSEGSSSSDGGRREGRSSNREPVLEALGDASPRVATSTPFGPDSRSASALAAEIRAAPGGFGAEAAERIARVLQLQDAVPTRPLSQVILRLDNAAGGEDRIRVDLRGSSVGAALSVGDPVTAARMHAELGQLQRALEGRGLQAEHLSVASLASRELADAVRTALPADAGQRGSQDSGAYRDGSNGRPGDGQRDADSQQPRHRPRRNSQQERNS